MYNRLHTVPACDGRTDRHLNFATAHIVRAMHTRRAVKIISTPPKTTQKIVTRDLWYRLHCFMKSAPYLL